MRSRRAPPGLASSAVLLAAFFRIVTGASGANPQSYARELNDAEKYVVERVTAHEGQTADLTRKFPDRNKRKLRGHFLELLLTGELTGVKPYRNAVVISGAVVDEQLELVSAQIPYQTTLYDCEFMNAVFFMNATFERDAVFSHSTFWATANFAGVKAKSIYLQQNTVFQGPVDFSRAQFAGSLEAQARFQGPVNFGEMQIGHSASFDNAVFEKPARFCFTDVSFFHATQAHFDDQADFCHLQIRGEVVFWKATFEGLVNFQGIKVAGRAIFDGTVFNGPVDFGFADITGNLQAIGTEFNNKEDGVSFNGVKIGGAAFLRKAVFAGAVDSTGADIGSNLEAAEAQFTHRENAVVFNSVKIGGGAHFSGAIFEGPLNFTGANIAQDFQAVEAQFCDKEHGVVFVRVKIGSAAAFRKAVFEGPVNFDRAEIADDFVANGAQFRKKAETAWMGIRCGGTGFFIGTTSAGSLSFADSNFFGLRIGESDGATAVIPQLTLTAATIKRGLDIHNTRVQDLVADRLHVDGDVYFANLTVEGLADFRNSYFGALYLSRCSWPHDTNKFHLQGMNFNYAGIVEKQSESESHKMLLELAEKSAYGPDVYGNLEAYFRQHGYLADADEAFVNAKHRERRQLSWWQPAWVGSMLLNLLVGYGRHPWQALIPCTGLVLIGCVLFSRDKMELQKKPERDDPLRIYNAFWYSLGLFLPAVNLQMTDMWKPKARHTFLRQYVRIQILLGWILIPIVIAALAGLIK